MNGDEKDPSYVEKNSELSFGTVCGFLNVLERYRRNPYMRTRTISKFIDTCVRDDTKDAFQVFRLILPGLDERSRTERLSEHRLIYELLSASDRKIDEEYTHVLYHWREKDPLALALGEPRELSELLKSKLFVWDSGPERKPSSDWKVGDVNAMLDRFCKVGVDGQVALLRRCMDELSADELKWLTRILLGNAKVYVDARDVLEEWSEYASMCYFMRGWTLAEAVGRTFHGQECHHDEREEMSRIVCGKRLRRQSSATVLNIHDAYMMMERRFRENLNPMSVVVEGVFDGYQIQVHRCGGTVTVFSNESVPDRYFKMLESSLKGMVDEGDFVVEAQVVVWNTGKECFEPRFVLDAVLDESGAIEDGLKKVECAEYSTYALPQYVDLEIMILVSDVLYLDDENVYEKALELRLESLETRFKYSVRDRQEGFPLRVKVLPLIPQRVMVTGIPLCVTASNIESIKMFRDTVECFGSQGVRLRALEAEWNSKERLSTVVVRTYMGASIVNGIIIGGTMIGDGGVEYWDIGVVDSEKDNSKEDCLHVVPFARVRNSLVSYDSDILYSNLKPRIEYTEKPFFRVTNLIESRVVSISGTLMPPGRWNSSCAVMRDPALLGAVLGEQQKPRLATSTKDITRWMEDMKSKVDATADGHVEVRGIRTRTVAERFLPCDVPDKLPRNHVLDSKMVYFINHSKQPIYGPYEESVDAKSTRRYFKESCEKLVKQLGGMVSQNYTPKVDFVVAGHPTIVTNHFSRVSNIEVMSLRWLKGLLDLSDGDSLPLIGKGDFLEDWVEDNDTAQGMIPGAFSPFSQSPVKVSRVLKKKHDLIDIAREPGGASPASSPPLQKKKPAPAPPLQKKKPASSPPLQKKKPASAPLPQKASCPVSPKAGHKRKKAPDTSEVIVEEINLVDDVHHSPAEREPEASGQKHVDTVMVDLTMPEQRPREKPPSKSPARPKMSLKDRAKRFGLGKS
ncbi:hypothetical protein M9435_003979 [Picochlorum sp. BPE23]|nr:hypothetical protein M9435_003979 [Picochlorum sp. BPE23]